MGLKLLLDSVVLIDHFNGHEEATEYLRASHGEAAISVITRAEVLAGFKPPAPASVLKILNSFPTLPIDAAVADLAATLRQEHRWKLPDAFQAALALRHELRLATSNTKGFPAAKHKFVQVPYKIRASADTRSSATVRPPGR